MNNEHCDVCQQPDQPTVTVGGHDYQFDGDQICVDLGGEEGFEFLMYHPFTNPTGDQIREFIVQHGGGVE